jgi:deoxyguanosine kinase
MDYKYVVVEGNIGAGKTTLANKLAEHMEAKLVLETFKDNPYLPFFYENPAPNALPLELSFLMDRVEQLKDIDFSKEIVVADYAFEKSQIFAGVTLNDREMHLFKKVVDSIKGSLPEPDLFIYLHAPISKLKSNIQKRGRVYGQEISMDYLEKIQNAYQPFLKRQGKMLMVEMQEVDFENESHFAQLVSFLKKGYDFTHHTFRVE